MSKKAIKRAVCKAKITKRASAHTFRHRFSTHLLQAGTDIQTIQGLLGQNDVFTTMIYTHVLRQFMQGVKSPFETMDDREALFQIGIYPICQYWHFG